MSSSEGTQSEIRKHYFLPEYVVIAPSRRSRPKAIPVKAVASDNADCPFCPGYEDGPEISRTPQSTEWQIRVIPNRFPTFSLAFPNAYGCQEIVVSTREHDRDLGQFTHAELVRLIDVYAERATALSAIPRIRYILIFNNEGASSGASQSHAHSQIYAVSFIPPHIREEVRAINAYRGGHGCVYCEIMATERQGPRLIWEDEHMIAFAPYAARSPYEAWILPRRHRRGLENLGPEERSSLATAFKLLLGRLEERDISYNYFIHNSLPEEGHHLHIEIVPRLTTWGGFELGSGVVINPVAPEETPRFYRPDVGAA
jgi:UDPglucose--hexose-1-phosphate uridylyltransferase